MAPTVRTHCSPLPRTCGFSPREVGTTFRLLAGSLVHLAPARLCVINTQCLHCGIEGARQDETHRVQSAAFWVGTPLSSEVPNRQIGVQAGRGGNAPICCLIFFIMFLVCFVHVLPRPIFFYLLLEVRYFFGLRERFLPLAYRLGPQCPNRLARPWPPNTTLHVVPVHIVSSPLTYGARTYAVSRTQQRSRQDCRYFLYPLKKCV